MCVTYGRVKKVICLKSGTSCVSHTGQFGQRQSSLNLRIHVCYVRDSSEEENLFFYLGIHICVTYGTVWKMVIWFEAGNSHMSHTGQCGQT